MGEGGNITREWLRMTSLNQAKKKVMETKKKNQKNLILTNKPSQKPKTNPIPLFPAVLLPARKAEREPRQKLRLTRRREWWPLRPLLRTPFFHLLLRQN